MKEVFILLTAGMVTGISIFFYMLLFFLIAQIIKNNGIADIAWGGGFILIGIVNIVLAKAVTGRQIIVMACVLIWGLRLILHIYSRIRGKSEDFRYRKMRERWGKKAAVRSFTHVFMLQGFFLVVIGFPIIIGNVYSEPAWTPFDVVGIILWIAGFSIETISDFQLSRFIRIKKSNTNSIMTTGLWHYSRHPNYFGEALLWWGIFIMILSVPYGWLTVFGPALLTFLLLKVSGVPLLEKRYADNPVYQEYAKKTSIFIPWFHKK
jgi:steroid 5-alpha reductase family enzyme